MKRLIAVMIILVIASPSVFAGQRLQLRKDTIALEREYNEVFASDGYVYLTGTLNVGTPVVKIQEDMYAHNVNGGYYKSGDGNLYRYKKIGSAQYLQCIHKSKVHATRLQSSIDFAHPHDHNGKYLLLSTFEPSKFGYREVIHLVSGCKNMAMIEIKQLDHNSKFSPNLLNRCFIKRSAKDEILVLGTNKSYIYNYKGTEISSSKITQIQPSLVSCTRSDGATYFNSNGNIYRIGFDKSQIDKLGILQKESSDDYRSTRSAFHRPAMDIVNKIIIFIHAYDRKLVLTSITSDWSNTIDIADYTELTKLSYAIDRENNRLFVLSSKELKIINYASLHNVSG